MLDGEKWGRDWAIASCSWGSVMMASEELSVREIVGTAGRTGLKCEVPRRIEGCACGG